MCRNKVIRKTSMFSINCLLIMTTIPKIGKTTKKQISVKIYSLIISSTTKTSEYLNLTIMFTMSHFHQLPPYLLSIRDFFMSATLSSTRQHCRLTLNICRLDRRAKIQFGQVLFCFSTSHFTPPALSSDWIKVMLTITVPVLLTDFSCLTQGTD